MTLVSTRPVRVRHRRYAVVMATSLVAVAGAVMALRGNPPAALVAAVTAAVVAHWAGRRMSDCRVLALLSGVPLHGIAMPLTVVAARSATPLSDVSRMRSSGAGVVRTDAGLRVLSAGLIERLELELLLTGRWDQLAVPAREVDGTLTVDRLRRLPDEDEVWLVRTSAGARMLSGDHLRAVAAERRARVRRRPAAGPEPPGADGRPAEAPHRPRHRRVRPDIPVRR